MKTLKFKCTLLTDVILNQKAATEGPNETLDFIPGNCFLGIAASRLYTTKEDDKEGKSLAMELFHSSHVRFGDAHPSNGAVRSLKIPTSYYHPKLSKAADLCFIHHLIDVKAHKSEQLKQCRNGFYTFANEKAKIVKTETNFAIKSAYDREARRSMDQQMYGYQSLQQGLQLLFDVEVDNDNHVPIIEEALCGERRIGRSRTAQYGLVNIEKYDFDEVKSGTSSSDIVTVYADGRLVFLDDYGLPTFRPTENQLELPQGAKICWEKSQIRTFQYAPWNFKRQCFDADRCGIEKGSVFVIDISGCQVSNLKSKYVGSFNNEGFGKVIYNPDFLKADETGVASYKITEPDEDDKPKGSIIGGTPLLDFIKAQKEEEDIEVDVYKRVNAWVRNNKGKFKGDSFASQWGTIRNIAMTATSLEKLKRELFDNTIEKNGKTMNYAYLAHGVAADKWKDRGRLDAFKEFVNGLNEKNARIAIINLAAEMAKKCKEDK